MKILWMAGFLAMVFSNVQAESLYRWVDKEGKVHYGDRPAEDAVKSEARKFSRPAAAGEDDLPYSVRKAKQEFPVTLYSTRDCGEACNQARTLLNKRGVPFAERVLSSKEDFEASKKEKGVSQIPSLTVGRTLLSGFEAGQWNKELDVAGYPATAPYGVRPVLPPAEKQPEASSGQSQ